MGMVRLGKVLIKYNEKNENDNIPYCGENNQSGYTEVVKCW